MSEPTTAPNSEPIENRWWAGPLATFDTETTGTDVENDRIVTAVLDIYDENGEVTSHAGAWRAGGGNVPGIFMPSSPQVGQAFHQEIAPEVAEDQAKVVALGETTEVPAGTYQDTVTMLDRNPLDGSEDTKVYARDVGLIVDEAVRMTRFVSAA